MTTPAGRKPIEFHPIGAIESPLTDMQAAPRQGDEGAPHAWLVLDPSLSEGLDGLEPGDRIIVLTFLDRADRRVLHTHPRNDPERAQRGVFATRSPDRPNPIGLHDVTALVIDGDRILVDQLDALDSTPILDIKPVLPRVADR